VTRGFGNLPPSSHAPAPPIASIIEVFNFRRRAALDKGKGNFERQRRWGGLAEKASWLERLSFFGGRLIAATVILLRQTLGVIVLVAGWALAFSIHYGIVSLVNAL
jgi:hypothetical protein